jgi:hypothetical protein
VLHRRDEVAAGDVELVGQPQHHRLGREGDVVLVGTTWLAGRRRAVDADHPGAGPCGQDDDLVTDVHAPRGEPTRIPPVVAVLGTLRADDVLHRHPQRLLGGVGADRDGLEVLEEGRSRIPGGAGGPVDDVVAEQGRERHRLDVDDPETACQRDELGHVPVERPLVPVDEVHLVDRERHVADPEQPVTRGAGGSARRRRAGVDEDQGELGRRGAGDHVARVLDVARGVGEDVRPGGGREVAVGDVDGDALLALGAQAVGEQGQVGRVEAPVAADALDGRELVARTDLVSCSSRPTSVDFPSSTLPAVASRSRSCRGAPGSRSESGAE